MRHAGKAGRPGAVTRRRAAQSGRAGRRPLRA